MFGWMCVPNGLRHRRAGMPRTSQVFECARITESFLAVGGNTRGNRMPIFTRLGCLRRVWLHTQPNAEQQSDTASAALLNPLWSRGGQSRFWQCILER